MIKKFKFFIEHELHEELVEKLKELEAFIHSVDENSIRSKDGRVTNQIMNCQMSFSAISKDRLSGKFLLAATKLTEVFDEIENLEKKYT